MSSPPFPSPSRLTNRSTSPSPNGSHSDRSAGMDPTRRPIVLGICAMDVKARSKPMREILTRLVERTNGAIEVKVFGDKVILDEEVENWPRCDVLISFFSTDFPLDKAVSYVKLRNPFCINDLPPQALLWDRRLVGTVLDYLGVPTPRRLVVSRDGGPKIDEELRAIMEKRVGISLGGFQVTPEVTLSGDGNSIIIDGQVMSKPFVEKPVSGEDHNVYIYFQGGHGRRLFRKVGNKSSEVDPTLNHPRTDGSYIYEEFIDVDNSEDIKVYTVGKDYTHAETRKSPVVDGVVKRNTEGKEIRTTTHLNDEERSWATKISEGFGQMVCGFDLLRCNDGKKSQVIDVNGWSFVKGNDIYYDEATEILANLCIQSCPTPERPLSATEATPAEAPTWLLKANVTVFRHADRTPKQKLKFNFPIGEPWTQPFVRLLNGEKEEIILRERQQLTLIATAVEEAKGLGASGDDLAKLTQLNNALFSKIDLPGTKAQLKPVYSRKQFGQVRSLTKLTLVFKWGGEFTHSAVYQSRDLGENLKKDISIMNKDILKNVKIYTSSERRVVASAKTFGEALLDSHGKADQSLKDTDPALSSIPRSNTPQTPGRPPSQTSANSYTPKLIVRKDLLDDSNAAKDLTDDVKKRLKILLRPGEPEKRPELTWPKSMKKEPVEVVKEVIELLSSFREIMHRNWEKMGIDKLQERWCCEDEPWLFRERWEKLFEDFCDVKQEKFDPSRVSELYDTIKYCALHHRQFLFAIFNENGTSPEDQRQPQDRRLHELYARAKALFDLVAPQEYGIESEEKEEIGILTSLPLLRNVVGDLENARNNEECSLTLYFTKESHIHTLVNLVLLSGLPIANRRIPELDYCSHITFELYERNHGRGNSDKEYSIRLSLSEGAHSSNVLDSALDSRHSLNVQSRRKLTQHLPYSLVIEKLSKHFSRVFEDEETDVAGSSSTSEPVPGPSKLPNKSQDTLPPPSSILCAVCATNPAIYTCPRCQLRTCSLPCSTTHKNTGAGCSGIRNKAAYVPMNQYGYMTLMNDYVYLEEVGRKIGDWGREIATGGYQAHSANGRYERPARGKGRGRGYDRGRGGGRGGSHMNDARTKRDVLKMELDFLDIEVDLLPVGMERRTLNQSTWDSSNRTALLTVELVFYPPRFLLPSATKPEPVRMLTHRNRLDRSLSGNLAARLQERSQSKKKEKDKPLPEWLTDLITPPPDDAEGFVPPVCVMSTKLDPLAAVSSSHSYGSLRPGHITRQAFFKLPFDRPLSEVLKHKHFVEFPTIEIWEEGTFTGVVVNDKGSIVHRDSEFGDDDGWRRRKRRKLGKKEGREALGGMLGGYGSGSENDGSDDAKEEKNVFNILAGYTGSDDEEGGVPHPDKTEDMASQFDYELGEEDAEGETDDGEGDYEFDDEMEDGIEAKDPEALAKLLNQLRQDGALRDPKSDSRFSGLVDDEEEQVDWGDSEGE